VIVDIVLLLILDGAAADAIIWLPRNIVMVADSFSARFQVTLICP